MTTKIISVSPETPVLEAISIMEENNISCLLVTQDKRPVGIFTERDIVLVATQRDRFDNLVIGELMTGSVVTAKSDIDIYEAHRILATHRIRHLVIVDSNGELEGVLTQFDIKNALELEYFVKFKGVSEIMTKRVVTMEKESSVKEAVSKMAKYLISCIIVCEDESPVGILTERDMVHLIRQGSDMETTKIEKVMSWPVLTVLCDTPAYKAVRMMNQKGIRRLVVVDEANRISGLITQSDITNGLSWKYVESLKELLQKKEEVLEETEKKLGEKIVLEKYKKVFELSPEAIVLFDKEGNILELNERVHDWLGYRSERFIGKNLLDLPFLTEEGKAKAMENFSRRMQGEEISPYELCFITKNGEKRVGVVQGVPIRDEEGKVIGNLIMISDVTEQKKIEERLIRTEKLAAAVQVVSEAAHEIRNPLSVITGGIYLLRTMLPKEEEVQKRLSQIEEAAKRTHAYIDEFLGLSKHPSLNLRLIQINEVLKKSLEELPPEILAGVEIEKDLAEGLPYIQADPEKLCGVFSNIIKNASEAMKRKGMLRVSSSKLQVREKDFIQIVFEDNGPGIPEENLEKIFDPFFTTKTKGTGLGLAICQQILQVHKGKIEVASEVGKGTTFIIKLRVRF